MLLQLGITIPSLCLSCCQCVTIIGIVGKVFQVLFSGFSQLQLVTFISSGIKIEFVSGNIDSPSLKFYDHFLIFLFVSLLYFDSSLWFFWVYLILERLSVGVGLSGSSAAIIKIITSQDVG